jgi:hypothetical protein
MSFTQNAPAVFDPVLAEAADPLAYAAHPPLARLTSALRAPLLPVIGFAELCAGEATPAERQAWASEILAASRQFLDVLDCTLALAAGRTPATADLPTMAAAADAVGALRSLLQHQAPTEPLPCCHH